MSQTLLAVTLVAYNTVLNRWPPFHGWAYVPANLAAGTALVAAALGPGELGPRRAGLVLDASDIFVGIVLGALGAAPLFALAASPRYRHVLADRRAEGGGALYRTLVRIPVGTALFEEVAFRGILLGALLEHGSAPAVIASAAVFGLWHVEPARAMARINDRPVAATVAATLAFTAAAGIGFGALRVASGSVALPVGLHAAFNSFSYVAARRALADHRIASVRS